MTAFAIIGCAIVGMALGVIIGFWLGDREGGDYNFAPALYAPFGGMLGCLAGAILGAVLFAP